MRRATSLALVVVALLGTPAAAHERVSLDPDDSPGPLDVVASRIRHADGTYTFRAVTYEEWPDTALDGNLDYIRFDLDHPGRGGIERCVLVGSATAATLYKGCDAPLPYRRAMDAEIVVARPDTHSIEVMVAVADIWERRTDRFRWSTLSSFERDGHPDCPPPEVIPPEHFVGTCWDQTDSRAHASR